jgi:type II secretory pathway pseudopilin PulG
MRIYPKIQSADAKEMSRQGERAFTMVEIAIAIGVIGFALVAIIGILPAGMNVQKDNREDTLISQDAPYFLDAIRNGVAVSNGGLYYNTSHSLDFLTNYVQSIQFVGQSNGAPYIINTYPNANYPGWSGAEIIGLLSVPQYNYNAPGFASNYFDTVATVRALSGPATEQNGLNSVMAFTYKMEVMITPFNSFAPWTTNYPKQFDSNQVSLAYNRFLEATPQALLPPGFTLPFSPYLTTATGALQFNLFEVRLRFSWPVLQNGKVGPGHQTYRTLIAGQMVLAYNKVNNVQGCWFFQPQTFGTNFPSGL